MEFKRSIEMRNNDGSAYEKVEYSDENSDEDDELYGFGLDDETGLGTKDMERLNMLGTLIHKLIYTIIYTLIYTLIYTFIHILIHTLIMLTHNYIHIPAYTHTCAHTYTHTYTHTYKHRNI